MSMANAMATSDGVRERGSWLCAPRLGGSGPGAPRSPLPRILATIGPLTCHAMDASLSYAA
jgi:hypothetical protein